MTRILWISRHTMTAEQYADLERIYGAELEITQYDATISDVAVLAPYIAVSDVIAVVLPLEKVADLLPLARDRPVIQAVSAREKSAQCGTKSSPQTASQSELPADALPHPHNAMCRQETDYIFVHQYWQQIVSLQICLKKL